jgi:outer membrane protein OmpA-like peptidoglycan-associated protein
MRPIAGAVLFVVALAVPVCALQAQDAKGCQDSPLVSRFPGSTISDCKAFDDNAFNFPVGPNAKPVKKVEGKYLELHYKYPATASKAQVLRNLHTAMKSAGYVFDYDSGDYGDFTVHMGKTWILLQINSGNTYDETIVAETAVTQDVVANAAAMSSGIDATGHTVVNGILFDTGKADVKPESAPALDEVVKLLQQDASIKLYVVGHTDNVGGLAANLDLSRRRAAAVVAAIVAKYPAAAARLASFGAGPYSPISTNDSEDGRTLNRRVELVKQ